jgi:endonuclease/exonuclease/phosphatase family metal-dependent hydrolase
MKVPGFVIVACAALAAGVGFIAWQARPAPRGSLAIATWNLQWLVDGPTARDARLACRQLQASVLPCDVARELSRDSADLARLAGYARRLDADVIAFQEVENARIARRVFRGYAICIDTRPGLQHVGFALKPGLAKDCGKPLESLTVGGQGRAGRELRIHPRGYGPVTLLVVHLKSGCARDPLDTASEACELLAAQSHALGQWIAERAAGNTPFIVLGDFNRGGMPDGDDPFWTVLHPATFRAAAGSLRYANCSWGAPYREFIDHILVSEDLQSRLATPSYSQQTYRARDAARYLLSDHCPISVYLKSFPDL